MSKIKLKSTNPKPCPNCESEDLHIAYNKLIVQISCHKCSMRGPIGVYLYDIVKEWNNLPRRANGEAQQGIESRFERDELTEEDLVRIKELIEIFR